MADLLFIRLALVVTLAAAAAYLRPFDLRPIWAMAIGAAIAAIIILFEIRLNRVNYKRLMGAAAGSLLGIVGAFLVSLVISGVGFEPRTASYANLVILLVMGYIGLIVGAEKGEMLNLSALDVLFGAAHSRRNSKLLDTSVIIDGRIADIAETGFLEGALLVPQFVLRELQMVADSADNNKRHRGRRGLEVLQRMQKLTSIEVRIIEDDAPHVREVDLKLIELARRFECKLLTNDSNLGKMAQLQRVPVLNIHELANTLKPVVLAGEAMRVFILKEGKEQDQGVAYLDDGTMVVVDHARRHIAHNVDITVTSVLQTTAGKMIFGRLVAADASQVS
ncbi:MAG TPA: PIN domain-containing protein [Terriglobales bacterium]|nr:PIN domain-containing protein [Terriglobales bacterium]